MERAMRKLEKGDRVIISGNNDLVIAGATGTVDVVAGIFCRVITDKMYEDSDLLYKNEFIIAIRNLELLQPSFNDEVKSMLNNIYGVPEDA